MGLGESTLAEGSRGAAAGERQVEQAWRMGPWVWWVLYFLYASAGVIFTRCYMLNTTPYLKIEDYLAGTERLPYQRRLLPMLILRGLLRLPFPHALAASHMAIFSRPWFLYLLGLNVLAVGVTGYAATLLYRRAQPGGRLPLLVFPVYLFCSMWTYLMRPLFGISLPYDLPSQAFFAAGLLFLYLRRFVPLLLVVAVGTFNRETTLFLVILFVIDAVATGTGPWPRRVPVVQTGLLAAAWLAVKLSLGRLYRGNDASEVFDRLPGNLHKLLPSNWPQILTACAFLLPVIWIFRRQVPNPRLAAWVYLLPVWVGFMMVYGVLDESRIFGELCPLVAVWSVVLLEAYVGRVGGGCGRKWAGV